MSPRSIAAFLNTNKLMNRIANAILQTFDRITAFALPLYDEQRADAQRQQYIALMNTYLQAFVPLPSLRDHAGGIACELVEMTGFEETEPARDSIESNIPFCTGPVTERLTDYLRRKCHPTTTTSSQFMFQSTGIAQAILMSISKQLEQAHRPSRRRDLFRLYDFVVRRLLNSEKFICRRQSGSDCGPFFFREIVHTLTRTILANANLFAAACSLLLDLCTDAAEHCMEELGQMLETIVSAVVSMSPDGTDQVATQMWFESTAPQLLKLLISNDVKLVEFVKRLGPIPSNAALSEVHDIHLSVRGNLALQEEIDRFMLSTAEGTPQSRLVGLRHLRQQLSEKAAEMATVDLGVKAGLVVGLQHIVRSSDSVEVTQLVAACLGEVGLLDTDRLTLPAKAGDLSWQPRGEFPQSMQDRHLLQDVDKLLTAVDVEVRSAASSSLPAVLASPRGRAAIDACKKYADNIVGYFRPFMARPVADQLLDEAPSFAAWKLSSGDIFSWELWAPPQQQCFQPWICKLTCSLIIRGSLHPDPFLAALVPICQHSAAFANRVLGFAMHDLLCHDAKQERRDALSAAVNRFFSHAVEHGSSPEPVRAVLQAIQFLQTCRREPTVSQGTASRATRNQVHTHWDNIDWLDLDFFTAAKAAAVCGSYFTSLYLFEVWFEISDVQSKPYLIATARNSIIEAYTKIGEPDGLYGFQDAIEAMSRLRMYEHEGKWDRAVTAYNSILRHPGSGLSPSPGQSPDVWLGMCKALHAVGHDNILRGVITGILPSFRHHGPQFDSLVELQSEMSWREHIWGRTPADTQEPPSIPLKDACVGVQSCLAFAIEGLAMSDPSTFDSVEQGRKFVIASLMQSNMQTAHEACPLLVQCQCLLEVEEVARIMLAGKIAKASANSSDDLRMVVDGDLSHQVDQLCNGWAIRLESMPKSSSDLDTVLALRCVLLRTILDHPDCANCKFFLYVRYVYGISPQLAHNVSVEI